MEVIEDKEGLSLLPIRPQSVREISGMLCSMDPWLTMNYRPQALEFYLLRADPALSRYSVMVSENLAGVLSVRYPWLFGPFIELVALFDGFRGKGIGGRILTGSASIIKPQTSGLRCPPSTRGRKDFTAKWASRERRLWRTS